MSTEKLSYQKPTIFVWNLLAMDAMMQKPLDISGIGGGGEPFQGVPARKLYV